MDKIQFPFMLKKLMYTLTTLLETEYGQKHFSASQQSNRALGPTQLPVQWVPGVFSGDKEAEP